MAAGDQKWEPGLEDKMVLWTSRWAEREIDRAADLLGSERQFKRRRREPPPPPPGIHVVRGVAMRVDASPMDDDPVVVAPEDATPSDHQPMALDQPLLLRRGGHSHDDDQVQGRGRTQRRQGPGRRPRSEPPPTHRSELLSFFFDDDTPI